ncbi:MAG TPA: DegT/DnrJ/EryC1/StrS family aminotransferase, partial [Solirubrobacteraceae bacterium]
MRFHGSTDKERFELVGYNSRLDAIQAAMLRVLLPHLDGWAAARAAVAAAYAEAGLGDHVTLPKTAPGSRAAWHLYVVRTPEPDALAAKLAARDIETRGYYRVPLHRQAPLRSDANLPHTDAASATNLALPMGPALTS